MPHMKRKRSSTGFYHVVTKGDGNQIIFEDDRDKRRYLGLFADAMNDNGVNVHAYVLMDNHTHALLEDPSLTIDPLSAAMKQLNERYAGYFCTKTGRVGHVFQGRFWSEPVEKEAQLLQVMRYIHANPEVAGMCPAAEYPWSSMGAYLGKEEQVPLTHTDMLLDMLGGREGFVRFSVDGSTWLAPYRGSLLSAHHDDGSLNRVAIELLGWEELANLKTMSMVERLPHIAKLVQHGFSAAQICRVTGLGRATIDRLIVRAEAV
jgi:REP element-mobilizing transposase RayT